MWHGQNWRSWCPGVSRQRSGFWAHLILPVVPSGGTKNCCWKGYESSQSQICKLAPACVPPTSKHFVGCLFHLMFLQVKLERRPPAHIETELSAPLGAFVDAAAGRSSGSRRESIRRLPRPIAALARRRFRLLVWGEKAVRTSPASVFVD